MPDPHQTAAHDPTERSLWRPLHRLLSAIDDDIAHFYVDLGIEGLKTSWVMEILRLDARGPMTITELARSLGRTHSALSQKVAAMRKAGWLETSDGPDARSKLVTLTPKAKALAPTLAAEWHATESALADLEAEIPYALSRVVEDINQALSKRSFRSRIEAAASLGG